MGAPFSPPLALSLSTAVSLPCTVALDSPAAASLRAELQVLLAELKRLGLQQQQLQQDAHALDADRKPRKGNTAVAFNLPLLPHHAVLRQSTYGSSNWSEDTTETPPARNIISGGFTSFHVARDLLRIDFSPVVEETDCSEDEVIPPTALPMPPGMAPAQRGKGKTKRDRSENRLRQPRPNSPKPKLKPKKSKGLKASFTRAMESLSLNNKRPPSNSPQKQSQEQLPREASQQVLQQLPSLSSGVPAGSAEAQMVYSQHASKAWNGENEVQQQSVAWQAQHTGPLLCTDSNELDLFTEDELKTLLYYLGMQQQKIRAALDAKQLASMTIKNPAADHVIPLTCEVPTAASQANVIDISVAAGSLASQQQQC